MATKMIIQLKKSYIAWLLVVGLMASSAISVSGAYAQSATDQSQSLADQRFHRRGVSS